jgi:mono/diheme cytochrome c family protein
MESGAYLADALGHCGECHTPRNLLYGLDNSRRFAGETAQGWRAYNITSDRTSGIGDWSNDELVQFLTKGYAPGRGSASGNMAEAVEHSLRYLTPSDAQALAAYLKSVPAQRSDPPINPVPQAVKASSPIIPASSSPSDLGLQLFQTACAGCHSWNGEGRQTGAAALSGSRSVNDPAGTNLIQVILRGSSLTSSEGHVFMPPFGRAYDNVEVAALANYVIGHFGGKDSHITPDNIAKARDAAQ